MPQTPKAREKTGTVQAKREDTDLVARLADKGEEALHRFAELPGGKWALSAFNDLRVRVDDLGKKVRGIDALEARIAKLEKQVAELRRPRRATTSRRSTPRKRPPSSSPTAS